MNIPLRTNCSPNFSLIGNFLWEVLPKKTPKLRPIGSPSKKKEGYLQGKVENNKYPVVKTCGSRN